jgi:hypothetical protein
MVVDLKEELEQARVIGQKLQQDKRELAGDAKAARAYRDEIEMLKVQSGKVEKLEGDIIKYKQKVEDTEYLKKKIAVSLVGRGGEGGYKGEGRKRQEEGGKGGLREGSLRGKRGRKKEAGGD